MLYTGMVMGIALAVLWAAGCAWLLARRRALKDRERELRVPDDRIQELLKSDAPLPFVVLEMQSALTRLMILSPERVERIGNLLDGLERVWDVAVVEADNG